MRRRRLLGLAALGASKQQVADTAFDPPIGKPAFALGKGPVVGIDEAHHNFHTVGGRYQTFARLLRKDGFVVRAAGGPCDVFVVANALHASNANSWELPNLPAFSIREVAGVAEWVRGGGALLLIADHQPFPGAASTLAAAFGVTFHNGYGGGGLIRFDKADGSLREHSITRDIDAVMTFQGSAFRADGGEPLLVFGPDAVSTVRSTVERAPIGGWLQGAVLKHGRGRVAVFGEAAMFSAQLTGTQRRSMGMNHPDAGQNPRFLLNVMRWLSSGPRVGRAPLLSSR